MWKSTDSKSEENKDFDEPQESERTKEEEVEEENREQEETVSWSTFDEKQLSDYWDQCS